MANPVHPSPPINAPSLTLRGTPFPTQRGVVAGTGNRQLGASLAGTALATLTREPLSPDSPIQGLCGDSGARAGPQRQVTTLLPERQRGGVVKGAG